VPREELLRRDNVDKGWGKRGLSACRYIPRDSLTGIITPVRKYLQALALQTFSHSGATSAVSSTWCILAGIIIPAALYLQSLPVRKGLYSKAKEEIGSPPRRLTRYGVE